MKIEVTQKQEFKFNLNKNKFKEQIRYETASLNLAFYKIFSDFFNMIYQDKKLANEHGIKDIVFFREKFFYENLNLTGTYGENTVFFTYKNLRLNFSFDRYKQHNEIYYTLIVTSSIKTDYESEAIFKIFLNKAISLSNLKGSYIEMPPDLFSWKRKELEKRGFDDIFLPITTFNDLHLFINVFEKKDIMMRYLMVGNPGTGKTESTLIIANELLKRGVTIIKTPVCEFLKEKIELAEALAPCVIMFDDLDLSIGSRSKGGYSPKELQNFLDALDGTDKISEKVGILATTNSSHLLDLAAQRPGRFEKILVFDTLTKSNIRDIILKSLKYNFKITLENSPPEIIKLFYNKEIVNKFHEASVTGAHVYNSIKILKFKMDMLSELVDLEWILKEIQNDLDIMDKLKKTDHLKTNLSPGTLGIGFKSNGEDNDADLFNVDCGAEAPELREEVRRNSQRN